MKKLIIVIGAAIFSSCGEKTKDCADDLPENCKMIHHELYGHAVRKIEKGDTTYYGGHARWVKSKDSVAFIHGWDPCTLVYWIKDETEFAKWLEEQPIRDSIARASDSIRKTVTLKDFK